MTREAEQRELRLRADMEKLRIQQEQSLGSLDTKIDAMMERRTQAIMDRLDGLLSSKSGPKRRRAELGRSQQGTEGELQRTSKEEDTWIH